MMKREKLADTLEMIANKGPDAFYNGKTAEDVIRDIQEAGGTLTVQDLASYRATVTDCVGDYSGRVPDIAKKIPEDSFAKHITEPDQQRGDS
ncbi:hypothetical protein KUCAC02_028005 [Chaenocephalus aceratus]|uniref:Uncharacterized protein n=1 Tax=Chaenocephalus aceratus TaxID=36190 RepID=A0ACB9X2B7_CHAAC|nr:hypothetical protein KUCAC02_028005 [Chaenocephalus aceratus]